MERKPSKLSVKPIQGLKPFGVEKFNAKQQNYKQNN